MTNSIAELLNRGKFEEPPEIRLIKAFVEEHFHTTPKVAIQQTQIIIMVPSAALAGSLRMHLYQLQQQLDTKKRLVIRIGS
ncbi:MAG: hypothetical protein JWL85_176 [Candidatus Saccharibacteria bacterium]|nr:hypothetical protein [Candidatus Saccharibacteria bacterium]